MTKRHDKAPLRERVPEPAAREEDDSAGSAVEWYERERWHLMSGATPLNARGLLEPGSDGRLYVHKALDYVNEILHSAIKRVGDGRISPRVFGHLEIAVQSALFSRIEENEQKTIPADCDEWSAELFQRACVGVATPWELLALLATFPDHLKSLELAKQTHPIDWLATDDMDIEIEALLSDTGAIVRESERMQNVRYSLTRVDDTVNPEVATFVRKAEMGLVPLDDGGCLTITQRDCLVVDMTHVDAVDIGAHMRQWLATPEAREQIRGSKKIPYSGDALREFVSGQLATQETLRSPALVPAVRSYYAHYTPLERGSQATIQAA